jgi:hypothetical protein
MGAAFLIWARLRPVFVPEKVDRDRDADHREG